VRETCICCQPHQHWYRQRRGKWPVWTEPLVQVGLVNIVEGIRSGLLTGWAVGCQSCLVDTNSELHAFYRTTKMGILTHLCPGLGVVRCEGTSNTMSEFKWWVQSRTSGQVCWRTAWKAVNAKRELHAFDCARLGILRHLPSVFLIGCMLVNKEWACSGAPLAP
jgi:hypothetical protein